MANGKVISHVAKIYGFHLQESHVEAAAALQTPQNVAAVWLHEAATATSTTTTVTKATAT